MRRNHTLSDRIETEKGEGGRTIEREREKEIVIVRRVLLDNA